MTTQIASHVGPSKIDIAYECFGPDDAPPLLLVMGLGMQMLGWHEGLCEALAARGLRVIRFDNRDAGLSSHMTNAPPPNFMAALVGDMSSASYDLSDMAADTVGLLDALKIERAHVVGASLGGFVAQTMAIEHPARVRSLTSIMSSTGSRAVGQPHPEAMRLFAGLPPSSRAEVIERALDAFRAIGSPAYPVDENEARERAGRAYDRSYDPTGTVRQALAVLASGDRTARLRSVKTPTLVIHGANDRMCDVSGGRATAAAIPGAELVVVEGMGHDLPRALWPRLVTLIAEHVVRAATA